MSGFIVSAAPKEERLKIFNQTDDPDGAGGVKREGFAIVNAIDDAPSAKIRLALRLRLKPNQQLVRSFELFDGTHWNQLVGNAEDDSVGADAETFWKPQDPNLYWQGYLFPANWVQRPFQGAFTRLDFGPASSSKQRIDWLVNLDPHVFQEQYVIGHSDIKAH